MKQNWLKVNKIEFNRKTITENKIKLTVIEP